MPKNRSRQKREKAKVPKKKNQQHPKYSCSHCKGTGMATRDLKLFVKNEPCEYCDIWETKVQALIPK